MMTCQNISLVQTLVLGLAATSALAQNPVEIGSARQLFIDTTLMDAAKTTNVVPVVNRPESIQKVMTPDQPWEALGFSGDLLLRLFPQEYDLHRQEHSFEARVKYRRPTRSLAASQSHRP